MNSIPLTPVPTAAASHHVEFYRLPAPGKRDPHFGLPRGWYYKAAGLAEIKMVAVRQRGALRGVRLVGYDSLCAYIRRAAQTTQDTPALLTNKSGAGQTRSDVRDSHRLIDQGESANLV